MNLNEELNLVKNYDNSGKYINEPGVFIVEIKSYSTSENKKDYKGNPFIEFTVEDEKNRSNTITFYRITGKESENAREFKLRRLKEFFTNAGYDDSLEGEEQIKSVIGKKVKALFKKVEYIGKEKDNYNKPVIKEITEYSFSVKIDETIKGNQSYFHTQLKPSEIDKFKERLADWEAEHKNSANQTATTTEDKGLDDPTGTFEEKTDDLPF